MAMDKVTMQNSEAIKLLLMAVEQMQKQIDELTIAVEKINNQLAQKG